MDKRLMQLRKLTKQNYADNYIYFFFGENQTPNFEDSCRKPEIDAINSVVCTRNILKDSFLGYYQPLI